MISTKRMLRSKAVPLKNRIGNPITFWLTLEGFVPQSPEKPNPHNPRKPVYRVNGAYQVMPWEKQHAHRNKRIATNFFWSYRAQSVIYDAGRIITYLTNQVAPNENVYEERSQQPARLFDLAFDEFGHPIAGSLAISMAGWSMGKILQHGLTRFCEGNIQENFREEFDIFMESVNIQCDGKPIATRSWLDALAESVIDFCGLPREFCLLGNQTGVEHRLIAYSKKRPNQKDDEETAETIISSSVQSIDISAPDKQPEAVKKPEDTLKDHKVEDELLNSFYLGDLDAVARLPVKEWGKALHEYITAISGNGPTKTDLRTQPGLCKAFENILHPDAFPPGRWPSEHPLVYGQQVAVNALWEKLSSAPGIFSVNGPPGTGKTTLLRDVAAAVVTERANHLALFKDPGQIFITTEHIQIGQKTITYHDIHPDVRGFGILVASSNNGAVANVSLEMPELSAISEPWRSCMGVDYFSELASEIIHKPAWGLIAARLGNATLRGEFTKFWFGVDIQDPDDETGKRKIKILGLSTWLAEIRARKRSPTLSWEQARTNFIAAREKEHAIRLQRAAAMRDILGLPARLEKNHSDLQSALNEHHSHQTRFSHIQDSISLQSEEVQPLQLQVDALQIRIKEVALFKPGFLANLRSLGRAETEWRETHRPLLDELVPLQETLHKSDKARLGMVQEQGKISSTIARLDNQILYLTEEQGRLNRHMENCIDGHQKHWGPDVSETERENASPWSDPEWLAARTECFLTALALHKALFESCPNEWLDNLSLASSWLKGELSADDGRNVGYDSLTMLVPVISSTFASVATFLRGIQSERIGWLLIDEAGQATPQAAVGALWRSSRAVVVGDPLQLEPIFTVPARLEAAIARAHDMPSGWWPSLHSAQELADQANAIGTWLPATGPHPADAHPGSISLSSQGKPLIWVGAPLRVHRRCDEPMFSISNAVAYDGLMLHGKPHKPEQPPVSDWPPSGWVDVCGTQASGNWIAEEGQALDAIIMHLLSHGADPRDIFLISPFRGVVDELYAYGKKYQLDIENRVGTVHRTQGKEADIVILVLGGDPNRPGAKDWAAAKPNLLNVAASRAKKRLYVVGHREEWGRRPHFGIAREFLPVITVFTSTRQIL